MMLVVGSSALVFLLLCFFIARRVLGANPALFREVQPAAVVDADARNLVTDLVAGLWIVVCVYTFLLICIPSGGLIPNDLVVSVMPLIAACAALERWRWSRNAILGMGAVIVADLLVAAVRFVAADGGFSPSSILLPSLWITVLKGFSGDWQYGAVVAGTALFTVFWMAKPSVKLEFEYRKRVATRKSQLVIAMLLVAVYTSGMNRKGLSTHVRAYLVAREEAKHTANMREIALRATSTKPPAARR
jgi:hypothetical protein